MLNSKATNIHSIKINSNKSFRVEVHTKNSHKEVQAELIAQKIRYYTYTFKDDEPLSYIIKGLHHTHTEEEIADELHSLYPELIGNIIKIENYNTPRSVREGKKLNIFLIQFKRVINMKDVLKCNRLLHVCITWEPIKKRDAIQWRNCQRIEHIATNCHLEYRCVQCNMNPPHTYGECPLPKEDNEKENTFCTNCGQHGHPATYRGCNAYLRIKEKIVENSSNRKVLLDFKKNSYNNLVNSASKFSDITKQKKTIRFENNNNDNNRKRIGSPNIDNINLLNRVSENLFVEDFSTTITKLQKLIKTIRNTNNTDEQRYAFIEYAFSSLNA